MRIAIASFAGRPPEFRDDELLAGLLADRGAEASVERWDDESVEWTTFDVVVIRSTWDYAARRAEFLTWADERGDRLHNPPGLVRWNSDKRYLADLAEAGIPTVATTFVGPRDPLPELGGEVVVKPSISAGGRDTGRFGASEHGRVLELVEAIRESGRTAMVQPYLHSVDATGETAIVLVDGELSHELRKGAVLRPDEVAPVRDDALGAAEVMYDPDLVRARPAEDDERELASRVCAELTRRFGAIPLYVRVDMVRDGAGAPVVLEVEAVEPSLYHGEAPGSAERLADAIVARAVTGTASTTG